MGIFEKLNPIKQLQSSIDNVMDGAIDLADQAILDKDKLNEIRLELYKIATNTYLAELSTQTVPWVDALHKMGRQILSLVTVLAVAGLLFAGIDLSQYDLFALLGGAAPASIYNYVKGHGK